MNASNAIYKKEVATVMTKAERSLLQNNSSQTKATVKKIGRFAIGMISYAMIAYLIAYFTMFIFNNGQLSLDSFSSSFAGVGIVGALMYIFGKIKTKCESLCEDNMIIIKETVFSNEPEETELANCG